MLVSVTALGARADRTKGAARDIVSYLEGGIDGDRARPGTKGDPAPALSGSATGQGGYYSDAPEQAGRWRGVGAEALGDTVDPQQFSRVLLGQDPFTGDQLVAATGSAGRAKHHPRADRDGDPAELLTMTEAAKLVGVADAYLRRVARRTAAEQAEHDPSTAPEAPSTGRSGSSTGARSGTYLSAEKLDGQWMATRAEVERFIADRQVPQVVMAYDVTFSAPKSLSILWATGSPEVQALVEEAFEAGVARGLAYLEANAVWIRRGRGSEPAGEMIAASYRHSTNRELEPQLHEHVVIANMGTGPDGRVQALDGRGLFVHATTAGYLAEAEMQHACNRQGIAWTATHRGIANVEGVSDEAIRAMSTRRQQILNLTNELGSHSTRARQQAALMTRAGKTTGTDPTALRQAWAERLATHGFGPAELHAATTAPPTRLWTPADTDRLRRHLAGPEGVTEQKAIFDRRDVIQTTVDHAGGRLSADEVEHHADAWLHSVEAIPLEAGDHKPVGVGGQLYTTPTMIRLEKAIANSYQSGHDTHTAVVPARTIDTEIARWETASGHPLGDDQKAMIHAICGSGDRHQAVVGPAGSGKTAALEVAARAWEAAGYKVIGAAVNGTAAEVLQRATGIPSRTVAGLVTRLDTAPDPILSERSVVIVDEASTLGNRHHARLAHHVDTASAAMRTIGDPHQHSSVDAGGMWAELVARHPNRTPTLVENRRQSAPEMTDVRLANADYRNGRVADAIARLDANQRIVTAPNTGELLDALAADWYLDQQIHSDRPSRMIAEHHTERRALNARAQALLRSDGTLTGPGVTIGEATFHVGDHVIARAANRHLHPEGDPKNYIRNGTTGTITAIDDTHLTVDFDHRGSINVPSDWLTTEIRPGVTGGIAPAYALTSHAAQGDTYAAGRMLATETSQPDAVYVGLTRGTHDARLYTITREPSTTDTDPRLPRIDPRHDDPIEALTHQLDKTRPSEVATTRAPDIAAILEATNRPLAQLEATTDAISRQAATIVTARITRLATVDPSPTLEAALGPRHDHPDPALWDDAATRHALYRARWDPDYASTLLSHPPTAGAPASQRADHDDTRRALLDAQAAHLADIRTSELAGRRNELVAQAHQKPAPDARLLRHDYKLAVYTHRRSEIDLATARAEVQAASTPRSRRHDPDRFELARRRLTDAERQHATSRERLASLEHLASSSARTPEALATIRHQIAVTDTALEPRIRAAVENPAPYLIEALDEHPGSNPLWDHRATIIETFRHAALGKTPADGPLSQLNPALGPEPGQAPLRAAWLEAAQALQPTLSTHLAQDR
ncbi:MAG: MobF family relaxase [Acidimicrobiales bacterium]|nr:MobF family relaxase [Acidimicrobiales bacterium]